MSVCRSLNSNKIKMYTVGVCMCVCSVPFKILSNHNIILIAFQFRRKCIKVDVFFCVLETLYEEIKLKKIDFQIPKKEFH